MPDVYAQQWLEGFGVHCNPLLASTMSSYHYKDAAHHFCQNLKVTHSGLNHLSQPYRWRTPTKNGNSRCRGTHTGPMHI